MIFLLFVVYTQIIESAYLLVTNIKLKILTFNKNICVIRFKNDFKPSIAI